MSLGIQEPLLRIKWFNALHTEISGLGSSFTLNNCFKNLIYSYILLLLTFRYFECIVNNGTDFVQDENLIATAATNGAVVLWNLGKSSRSKQLHVFTEHTRTVNKVFLTTSLSRFQMKLREMLIRILQIKNQSCIIHCFVMLCFNSGQFSPNGSIDIGIRFSGRNHEVLWPSKLWYGRSVLL